MAGRPKSSFSDEQIQEMSDHALAGCQNNTISTLMDIPKSTLIRHFGKLLTKKRAERKSNLRCIQTLLAASNPAMAIFLGKNELDQKDKKEITDGNQTQAKTLTPEYVKLCKEVAKEVMARQRQESIKLMEGA